LGDDHLLLGQTLLNHHKPGFDLALVLLDLGELAPDQFPGRALVLTEVVDQALLLFLKGGQSPLQSLAFLDGGRVGTLRLAPLQLGRHQ
jgi:hypothetical protein